MKKLMIAMTVVLAAAIVTAAPTTKKAKRGAATGAEEGEEAGKAVRVKVDQYPKLGKAATAFAPSIGESLMGPAWNGKPRRWIVLEGKYTTMDKCIDQLTFTWHVLLETKSATSKDKEGQSKLAPYSYFSQTVTYVNIPRGSHASSVCLHPSYLEQYGEPKAIGLVITDSNGQEIEGNSFSEIKGIKSGTKFWEDDKIMDAKVAAGSDQPMIERRQGLQERSKTIWALVNPNDYELVQQ